MKVKEMFSIEEFNILMEKADEGDYWESCYKFVEQIQDKEVSFLSSKQRDWLDKIVEKLC